MSNPVAATFDLVAADYDRTGVAFFGPIADRLVDAVDPQPGERCLDVGSGRGAVSARLMARVGPTGHVLGVDLSPRMVQQAARDVPGATFHVGDAMAPAPANGAWDVVTGGLVLFFLPDPVAALRAWRDRLRPGGRVGITTFGAQDPRWRALDQVLSAWMPQHDPRAAGARQRFSSDESVEEMLREAGFADVTTRREPLTVVFDDAEQWYRFSTSTGQRAAWERIPPDERPQVRARCPELLEQVRREDGAYEVSQDVRVTTGRRPV